MSDFAEMAKTYLTQLRSGSGRDRIAAADALRQQAIAQRQSLLPRGTITQPAEPLVSEKVEEALCEALSGRASLVHPHVIAALAQVGGRRAAECVSTMLKVSRDRQIRIACIRALGLLGGIDAWRTLRGLTHHSEADLAHLARWAATELSRGGTADYAEGGEPLELEPPMLVTPSAELSDARQRLAHAGGDQD